ncbi:hypothetical protein BRC86_13210, partial [Halobacteriales archaeon QS_3_64_16]
MPRSRTENDHDDTDRTITDYDEDHDDQDPSSGRPDGRATLDRRACLRLAGTTLAGAAALGAGVGSVSGAVSGEIDAKDAAGTLEVAAGASLQVHVGENQYGEYGDLENVLIDITADGADVLISTHGGSWVIRNVGVRGESNGSLSDRPLISAKTKQSDESGRIENVYLGDGGDHGGHGSGRAGIHVAYGHRGTVTIKDLNVANWT